MADPRRKAKEGSGTLDSQVLRLLDLVDCQKDSIVSREMVKKDTGTATLYAFDQGQGLSEHTAPLTPWSLCWKARRRLPSPGNPFGCKGAR